MPLPGPCLLTATPIPGQPLITIGIIYVDDFPYWFESDDIEKWFETKMAKEFTVDFMGPVSYFLRCRYDRIQYQDGDLTLHMSQEGFPNAIVDKFETSEANLVVHTPPIRTEY